MTACGPAVPPKTLASATTANTSRMARLPPSNSICSREDDRRPRSAMTVTAAEREQADRQGGDRAVRQVVGIDQQERVDADHLGQVGQGQQGRRDDGPGDDPAGPRAERAADPDEGGAAVRMPVDEFPLGDGRCTGWARRRAAACPVTAGRPCGEQRDGDRDRVRGRGLHHAEDGRSRTGRCCRPAGPWRRRRCWSGCGGVTVVSGGRLSVHCQFSRARWWAGVGSDRRRRAGRGGRRCRAAPTCDSGRGCRTGEPGRRRRSRGRR